MCALFGKKAKTPLPPANQKTGSLVQNDKLIIVVGSYIKEAESIVRQFCRLYQRNDYKLAVKIHPVEERIAALTFPDDIDFVVFFYLVKRLNDPTGDQPTSKVVGWCTIPPIEMTHPVSRQVMLYAGDNSKSVYMTTQDNISWRINFDKNRYETSSLVLHYAPAPYSYLEIKHRNGYIID